MANIGREAGLLVSYTELAKAWYRVKKAVWEARKHGNPYLVIRPATTQPCGFQVYSTRWVPDEPVGLHSLVPALDYDDFNWVANAMDRLEQDGYFSAWAGRQASHSAYTELDAFLNEAVMFEMGLGPNASWVEGKLAEHEGTLKLTDHNFEFVYDDAPYNKYLKDQVHSTTFLDVEEAVAVFGRDVISDVLNGEERRVTYLRFRAK